MINNEWLRSEYDDNLHKDLLRPFFNNPLGRRHLRRFARKKTLKRARAIGFMLYTIDKFYRPKFENPEHWAVYQDILNGLLAEIEFTLEKIYKFPNKLNVIEAKITRGFDFFNATSAPWFGENLMSIQSGLFFMSHTLARALEILLIDAKSGTSTSGFLKRVLRKRYVNASAGIISQDHTKTFSTWRLIPLDDSLLDGIELFAIAHEYAHLMYAEHSINDFNYSHFFTQDQITIIESDEEIAADAFALLIVYHYFIDGTDKMGYYAPRFLFKNLCLYESAGLLNLPDAHPTNSQRYEYIKDFQSHLCEISNHKIMDEQIDQIWEQVNIKIEQKARTALNREKQYMISLNEAMSIVVADAKARSVKER